MGVAIVLSDFLDPAGYDTGLTALVGRGFQVDIVQILAPEELSPTTYGDLRLVDSETGAMQEVTFGRYRLKGYQQTLQNFIQRSVIMTSGAELGAPVAELVDRRPLIPGVSTLADAERAHIISTLRETNWVVGGRDGAAARLGVLRTTLIAKMRKLGISRDTAARWSRDLGSREHALAS